MTRTTTAAAVALGLILAVSASADPPQVKSIAPYGAQRGVTIELAITGSNLKDHPRFVAPFPFKVDPASAEKSEAGSWKPKITVGPEVPVGIYAVRVQTDDGISNPVLFSVGQLPQINEKEDNNTYEQAQAINTPAVVEGQASGNDVDFFKFTGRKGERIVIDAQCSRIGSGVDPSIRLTTASRQFVGSADDSPGLLTDARLFAVLPADGDYLIELSDSRYQGAGPAIYRLVVGALPVPEEIYPLGGGSGETVGFELRGGTLNDLRVAAATLLPDSDGAFSRLRLTNQALGLTGSSEPVIDIESLSPVQVGDNPEVREPADPKAPPIRVTPPVVVNGRIDPAGDEDRYVFSVVAGKKYRFRVEAAELSSALDGQLQVLGTSSNVLASADDTTLPPLTPPKKGANNRGQGLITPDPSLDYTVPSGQTEVTVAVRDLEGRGGVGFPYRLVVEPVVPTFDLRVDDSEINIPKGGTAAVEVAITRQGYTGPITLKVANPPAGLKVREGLVADGQNLGVLTLSCPADATFALTDLQIIGEAKGPEGTIVKTATKPVIFAQQTNFPTNVGWLRSIPAAPAQPQPVSLEVPADPIEVVHGFEARIPLKAVRTSGADAAIDVTALPLPPGLTVNAAKIAEKAGEVEATVKSAPDTAIGMMTIGLVGKGKFKDKTITLNAPGVVLNVVRPAAVEVEAKEVQLKPGETFELKGKVVRKGPFKEAVTIKLNGLPAGLKAEPVKVEPDKNEFAIKVVAEDGAKPATATIQVALAFQLDKKDYNTPPSSLPLKVVAK